MHTCPTVDDDTFSRKNVRRWILRQGYTPVYHIYNSTQRRQPKHCRRGRQTQTFSSLSVPSDLCTPPYPILYTTPLGVSKMMSKDDAVLRRRRVRSERRLGTASLPQATSTVTFSPIRGASSSRRTDSGANQRNASSTQPRNVKAAGRGGEGGGGGRRPISLPSGRKFNLPAVVDGVETDLLRSSVADTTIAPKTPPLPGWPPSHAFLMEMEKSAEMTPAKRRSWQRGPLMLSPQSNVLLPAEEPPASAVAVSKRGSTHKTLGGLHDEPSGSLEAHQGESTFTPLRDELCCEPLRAFSTHEGGGVPTPLVGFYDVDEAGEEDGERRGEENVDPVSPARTETVSDFSSAAKSSYNAPGASTAGVGVVAAAAGGSSVKQYLDCNNNGDDEDDDNKNGALNHAFFSNNNDDDNTTRRNSGGWAGWSRFALAENAGESCDEDSSTSFIQEAEAEDEVSRFRFVSILSRGE